jgi:hypothetical protein
MALNKPNQQLRRDLTGSAADLKWSAVELMRIAERLSLAGNEPDAWALLKMCRVLQTAEEKLAGYADEVRDGLIVRAREETPVSHLPPEFEQF